MPKVATAGWGLRSVPWPAVLVIAGIWSGSASAQQVAGMGQGEANINVRSDVRLAIKGTRATITERIEQFTEVMTDQMPELRKCYRELVSKRPTTIGSVAIRITLDQGNAPPTIELKETGGSDPDLTGCIRRVVTRASFKKVDRPAAIIATLDFENTRARGEAEMLERKEAQARVDVQERAGGGYEGAWSSNDGKVAFSVSSQDSSEAVEAVVRTLRKGFAGFADCRRRCEKGGLSPAGDLDVQLRLQRGGKASAKIGASSVAHKRAVPCVERVFKRLKFEGAPAAQRAEVRVTFGD